jgi:hypothetical protein
MNANIIGAIGGVVALGLLVAFCHEPTPVTQTAPKVAVEPKREEPPAPAPEKTEPTPTFHDVLPGGKKGDVEVCKSTRHPTDAEVPVYAARLGLTADAVRKLLVCVK